jgi:hypothetical protein
MNKVWMIHPLLLSKNEMAPMLERKLKKCEKIKDKNYQKLFLSSHVFSLVVACKYDIT